MVTGQNYRETGLDSSHKVCGEAQAILGGLERGARLAPACSQVFSVPSSAFCLEASLAHLTTQS